MTPPFRLEELGAAHERAGFSCGQDALDRYFQTQVTQDVRRRMTNCFVAVETATGLVAGFYTLSAASVSAGDLPEDITKRLPRYPIIPAARIGRLAVDRRFQGQRLGSALLGDAVERVIVSPTAAFAVIVDAKDEAAATFYERHGFQRLVQRNLTLFLQVASAAKTLRSSINA